jgi:hypothetical protein
MEAAQETLGTHQDTAVICNVLRDLASAADDAGEPSFTYGHLYALEEHRGDDARAAFLALVDDEWARRTAWMKKQHRRVDGADEGRQHPPEPPAGVPGGRGGGLSR